MEKRGLATQFNFIFILVAGAIILIFFVGFAIKYKGLQEDRNEIEVLKGIDNSLYALQSSSLLTTKEINIPIKTKFDCENIIISDKILKTNKFIFSPTELNKQTFIWYQPFELPFRVTDFYYIFPKNQKFYLIYDSNTKSFVDYILEKIPSTLKLNFEAIQPNQILNKKGKFIYFTNQGDLQIYPDQDFNYGTIKFKDKTSEYYGLPMLFGAIIAEDFDTYNCLKDNIIKETQNSYNLYKKKIQILKQDSSLSHCNYDQISSLLNTDNLQLNSKLLKENNEDLSGQGCVPVF